MKLFVSILIVLVVLVVFDLGFKRQAPSTAGGHH